MIQMINLQMLFILFLFIFIFKIFIYLKNNWPHFLFTRVPVKITRAILSDV